jgi:hypothetical protein
MMGIGLEDMESEGHNADNESLASYLSGALAGFPDNDHIPTRDTGQYRESPASYLQHRQCCRARAGGATTFCEAEIFTPAPAPGR